MSPGHMNSLKLDEPLNLWLWWVLVVENTGSATNSLVVRLPAYCILYALGFEVTIPLSFVTPLPNLAPDKHFWIV